MEKIYQFLEKSIANNHLAHSYLIIHSKDSIKDNFIDGLSELLIGSEKSFLKKALNFERLVISENEKQVIEIKEVRRINDFARLKPVFSKRRLVIIKNTHSLTLPAANNLLKIIEEPPLYLFFFLLSDRSELLPKTIISRCVILKSETRSGKPEIDSDGKLFYNKLLKMNLNERFVLAESLSKQAKLKIAQFLKNWLQFLGEKLDDRGLASHKIIGLIRKVERTKGIIERTYANPRVAIERLFMNID